MVRTLELIEYARVSPTVRFDSILLAEPVVNPLTMDIVYGIGDLITAQDIEALMVLHTIDYVTGIPLYNNNVAEG